MFVPNQILFEKGTMDYPIAKSILDTFKGRENIDIIEIAANKAKSMIIAENPQKTYQKGKKTLFVSTMKAKAFQTCKPSADYMLPLVSGCMGQCEYCYLHTQLGDKPFVRVNVNLEDIFDRVNQYIMQNEGKMTTFEGSATSDPLCVEPFTGLLAYSIDYFSKKPNASFRFVSKYADVDSLLTIQHGGKTEIRFSLNTDSIRDQYEHATAPIAARILAASKLMEAGYPVGFLIAPVFIYEGFEQEYEDLLRRLKEQLPMNSQYPVFFEVISHRYTTRAKNVISEIFPASTLDMNDEERQYKHGQFGYGKFVYKKESMQVIKQFFGTKIPQYFPNSEIKYII